MASKERIERLNELVTQAGSTRKAEQSIKDLLGVAPTHSALYKAMQSNSKTTDYVVHCYIRDLEVALGILTRTKDKYMKERECTWQHGDADFRLRAESHQDCYTVYLSINEDVSVQERNPILISVRLEELTALDEKFYVMTVGGLTIRNIPEEAAKEIAKTLDCELTERCDKCNKVAAVTFDINSRYDYICFDCLEA
ncbi:hypothetical protein ACWU37_21970 (plasmid) [Photobacterium damselae subsp. damselae]